MSTIALAKRHKKVDVNIHRFKNCRMYKEREDDGLGLGVVTVTGRDLQIRWYYLPDISAPGKKMKCLGIFRPVVCTEIILDMPVQVIKQHD